MQPFEEKCKGRLSLLALQVLADSKGIVWMYGEFVMLLKHIVIACVCLVRVPFVLYMPFRDMHHLMEFFMPQCSFFVFQYRTNAL